MIYPNFTLTQNDRAISFELMEEDMNYRPLVAFDNGTFAVLFFDQETAQLQAVTYLDQTTLLKLAPYPLTEGQRPLFQVSQTIDQAQANLEKETLAFVIIDKIRQQIGLESFSQDTQTHQEAAGLLFDLTNNLSDYLTSQRIHSYQRALSSEKTSNFVLTNDEWRELLADKELEASASIFEAPVYDPTFTILSWFSNPRFAEHLTYEQSEKIGIAFSEANMVVLVQEDVEGTEDSTSDDLR